MPPPIPARAKAQPAWQPGSARALAARFDRDHASRLGDGYSSARWLGGVPGGELGTAPIPSLANARFELLGGAIRGRYAELGLPLADRLPGAEEAALFAEALSLLEVGDELPEAIDALVRRVHVLEGPAEPADRGPGRAQNHYAA